MIAFCDGEGVPRFSMKVANMETQQAGQPVEDRSPRRPGFRDSDKDTLEQRHRSSGSNPTLTFRPTWIQFIARLLG